MGRGGGPMTAYAYIGKLKNGVSPENEIAIRTIRIMVGSRTRASVCRLHCCPLPKHLATVKKHSFGVGGNKNARRNKRKKRLNVCVAHDVVNSLGKGEWGRGWVSTEQLKQMQQGCGCTLAMGSSVTISGELNAVHTGSTQVLMAVLGG
eukprot:CAMPEP_0174314574 /NCGR_PEP_ID=MMETSP0810-20121108/5726_1 /TAXON_ID=73025 ORGANISM="Eutreptiella gymnastica-like, Strain CCMP1594" /NCGR_SAMPLE_ID=MMETSP0810 /ASSEMBLY_ACC=CAM_ASM_000659 /LENGTH=148 /DNA_ID=CAMNT_0015423703 /DNA_START=223 /DNA_END=670 /DNA_ORIENTATION=-